MLMAVRPNIETLRPVADRIAKCRSFEELFGLFRTGMKSDLGAIGENFADQVCIEFPHMVGFANFRPATGKEDWEEGTDAVGETHRYVKGRGTRPARAIRQDKAFDPFNPAARLDLRHLAGLQVPLAQGKVEGRHVMVFTTLSLSQVALGVKAAYPWIVARDHYEPELKGNARFFEAFAERILAESGSMEARRAAALKTPAHPLMKHQESALRHAARHRRSFICLPPGSGKTEIQGRLAARWLKTHHTLVYVAPTLALLDQNFYKVARHSHRRWKRAVMACSAKEFSVSGEAGFLRHSDLVFGPADGEEVAAALSAPGHRIVGTTYRSYPRLAAACRERNLMFDRIADEALEAIPSRTMDHPQELADLQEQERLWEAFADNSVVNRSACFDAFQKARGDGAGAGVGTDNPAVFGKLASRSFGDMVKAGTIVPPRIRAVRVDARGIEKMRGYRQRGWTKDDMINFTALVMVVEHVIADPEIANKKIVAFMHTARVCPKMVEPLRQRLRDSCLERIDAVIGDTAERNSILDAYRAAEHALMLNFGVLGKGIDDASTTVAFVGRGMASVYGMHGIHRPCRSHPDEFGKPPGRHRIKPCGYVYVVVVDGDVGSGEQYRDLRDVLGEVHRAGIAWRDEIRIVKAVGRRKARADAPGKPEAEAKPVLLKEIPGLRRRIRIVEETLRRRSP